MGTRHFLFPRQAWKKVLEGLIRIPSSLYCLENKWRRKVTSSTMALELEE